MKPNAIDQAFQQAIAAKIFSAAQVRVGKGSQSLWTRSYGRVSEQAGAAAVSEQTLFDIASLTKPIATATLAMLALEKKGLDPEAPVSDFFPAFRGQEKILLRQLLDHTSGLPAWLPIFEEVQGKGCSYAEFREFYINRIAQLPRTQPGTRVYSDLGFILLGFILEDLFSLPLAPLFDQMIAGPFDLTRTLFNPLQASPPYLPEQIAATEACPWRGRLLQGEVHDDNAFALGGVAGHAGLFSAAEDIEKWIHQLYKIQAGKSDLLTASTLQRFIGAEVHPKWGWDTVAPKHSQAGRYFSAQAVGHLAFTGCSFWLDRADGKYIVLLSNRVHPKRDDDRIKEFRPRIHDLLLEACDLV